MAMAITAIDDQLTHTNNTRYVEGVVNIKGEKIESNNNDQFGGWNAASRFIFIGSIESFIFYAISSNLFIFLTAQLGQSTATAAQNVNAWTGFILVVSVRTVRVVGKPYLDRFSTLMISAIIYVPGLLALSFFTSPLMTGCSNNNTNGSFSCSYFTAVKVIFFLSLYLIGIASSGCKISAPALGADQFDERNPNECKSKSSFFNWWLFGLSVGSCSSLLILTYVQDNLGWYIAFGISGILMSIPLLLVMFGDRSYRYALENEPDKVNPLEGLTNGLVSAVKNCRTGSSSLAFTTMQVEPTTSSTTAQLVPLWIVCLTYPIVHSQVITFFVKQGSTMDRSIGSNFQVPAASIQIFLTVSIILFTATYDRIFVPLIQTFTGKSNTITSLQKIGGGIFVSAITMGVAAIVENKRLKIVQEFDLIYDPKATVPMVIWWLIPQYILSGLALVLTEVGLQEFFYDQVPKERRNLGFSLYSTIFGIGDLFSVFLIFVIQKASSAGGQHGWLANNMNQGHLDYFYWFLAGLSVVELVAFLCFSKSYVYK